MYYTFPQQNTQWIQRVNYKHVFNYDYDNSDECLNWCSEIKSVFNTIDMIDIYANKTVVNLEIGEI